MSTAILMCITIALTGALGLLICLKLHRENMKPSSVMRCGRVNRTPVAYICSWCEEVGDGTRWAEQNGFMPSHGVCPNHKAEFFNL